MRWYLKSTLRVIQIVVILTILSGLSSCQNSGYLTPPAQTINASLNSKTAEGNPNFSYDGRYLIFNSDRNSQRRILLYDLQRRRILTLPGLNKPGSMQSQADISADGRYIVYVSEELGKSDIFVYDRVAVNTEHITKNFIGEVRHPTISGNGRFIAFEGNRTGQWDIEIYDRGLSQDLSLPQISQPDTPATDKSEP